VISNIVREEYGQLNAAAPKTMIDAGAYIGDTSAYFLSRYPELAVVALEPDAANYSLAQRNLCPYGPRARLLNVALASADGHAPMSGAYDGAHLSDNGNVVKAMTIPAVMELMGWQRVSVLKVDIEGAEVDVIGACAKAWLGLIDWVIIELHGQAIESNVLANLRRNGFDTRPYRSLWYCARRSA
jgi:FkbM family methyltransferase